MKSNKHSPTWPYLIVLCGLFALSFSALGAWQDIAPRQSAAEAASPRHEPVEAPVLDVHGVAESAPVCPPGPATNETPISTAHDVNVDDRQAVVADTEPPFANEAASAEQLAVALLPESRAGSPDMRQVPAPKLAPAPVVANLAAPGQWPAPQALVDQLDRLGKHAALGGWTEKVTSLLAEVSKTSDTENNDALAATLDALHQLANEAPRLAQTLPNETVAVQLKRTHSAIERRLDIWRHLQAAESQSKSGQIPRPVAPGASDQLGLCLAEAQSLIERQGGGAEWRNYLLLDELKNLGGEQKAGAPRERELAREVLDRLSRAKISQQHRKYIQQPALVALAAALRPRAAEPLAPSEVLTHIERYERTALASDARLVAEDCRLLAWSPDVETQELARRMESHYRNANLRIAVSGAFINRLLPQPPATQSAVRETIAGAAVRGRNTTFTKLSARLVPDSQRLRFGLVASGAIVSDTAATSGPATFYSAGESGFEAHKLFIFSGDRVKTWPAVASADSHYNDLVGLETDFDGVPLFGSLIRSIARSKHDDAAAEARSEVEEKVGARARQMLDAEIEPRLAKANQALQAKLIAPLDRLRLEAVPLEMTTTADRLTMRLRLGGEDQLGAHTPRPRAMSDSVISLQVHQSALNNVLEKLDLDGRKFTLPELFAWIGDRLGQSAVVPADLPENVTVTFAAQDAVRVRCESGRVEARLAIAELKQNRRKWRNFGVHTFYRPEREMREARFVRDGIVFLDGEQFRGKTEVVLRAIFSKVLSDSRPWSLVDAKLAGDPRLKDLRINQFIVEDGWIGLAYGPAHIAQGKHDDRAALPGKRVRK